MKKNIIVIALLAMGGLNAMAQDSIRTAEVITRVDTVNVHYYNKYHSRFIDNWSVEVLGSARVLFGEEDSKLGFGKRICPSLQVGLIKDLTPVVSLRGVIAGGALKGWDTGSAGLYKWQAGWENTDPIRKYLEENGEDCSNGYKQDIRYYTLSMDAMLNLYNLTHAEKLFNRKWNPYVFAGVEYYQMLKHKGCYATYKVGAHIGLKCDYMVTPTIGITGEVGASIHSATMDNCIGKGHNVDAVGMASIGVKFRLGKQDYRLDRVLPTGEYVRLANVTTNIKEQYKDNGSQTLIIGNLFAPSVVFDDDADTYSEELQMVNISRMAQYIKDNPSLKVSVIGNTHSVSKELAEKRAEIVRQKLIDRYNIDPNRLVSTTLDVNREYNVRGNNQSVNFGIAK